MLCLVCRCKLIQAFQHFQHKFLICRTCFVTSIRNYNNNAFVRVSLLVTDIPTTTRKLQHYLIKFIDLQKISAHNIFNLTVLSQYQAYISLKSQTQDLSTEYSWNNSSNYPIEQPKDYGFYTNYNWMKQKLLIKIKGIKQSSIGAKVTEKVIPMKQQITQKSSNLSSKFNVFKNQIKNITKEAPSLAQLRGLNLSGFFKSKYKSLF